MLVTQLSLISCTGSCNNNEIIFITLRLSCLLDGVSLENGNEVVFGVHKDCALFQKRKQLYFAMYRCTLSKKLSN